MPIIAKIGHKSTSTRLMFACMYCVLLIGSVTMVYPFLLMVAGTTKSAMDTPESRIIPLFLIDDAELYRKHMEGFFDERLSTLRSCYQTDSTAFRSLEVPSTTNHKLLDEWKTFLQENELPHYYYAISYTLADVSRGVLPINLRKFKAIVSAEFNGDINKVNSELGTQFATWTNFALYPQDYMLRYSTVGKNKWDLEYAKFKTKTPIEDRFYYSIEGFYKEMFLKPQYPKSLEQFNSAHGTSYSSWAEVRLPQSLPNGSAMEKAEWEDFVRNIVHPRWTRVSPEVAPMYRDYLKDRYMGEIKGLNAKYGTSYKSFDEIAPIEGLPPEFGIQSSDWTGFIQGWKSPETGKEYKIPAEYIRLHGIDFLFRDWLAAKYGDISKMNAALGTDYKSWQDVIMPQQNYHYEDFKKRKAAIRWEFMTRNHLTVLDYLFMHGRAFLNTLIYCSMTIICALAVNPLAAYALSRFKPPSAYKVLLFLMLTMAFPPVVTQIPNFLLLRELNLLNTFFALILPGLANGYSIFLLKGFFDSLPQELYESASIDGASEIRIFLQITMSLSKPILAVIALAAFTSAYSNFMMALLVCQDRKMWTIMPFLYELQQRSGQGVVFASLLIASIPTLLVFVLCQNVIMRGIVVPVEK